MAQMKPAINKVLSNVSQMYVPSGYVSEAALPMLPVDELTGLIGKYTNQHLRKEDDEMGGEQPAKRVKAYETDISNTYRVSRYGLTDVITVEDGYSREKVFDLENSTTIGLTTKLWIGKESRFADQMRDINNYETNNRQTLAGASQWSDYDNSNPIEDVKNWRQGVKRCGFAANRLNVPYDVIETMTYHPQILRNMGYADNRAGALKYQEVADFFKVSYLHVADVRFNDSIEGQADSMEELWGKDIQLYYAPEKFAKEQICFGYLLRLKGKEGRMVKSYFLDNPDSTKEVYVEEFYGFKFMNNLAGFIAKDVIA